MIRAWTIVDTKTGAPLKTTWGTKVFLETREEARLYKESFASSGFKVVQLQDVDTKN